MLVIWKLSKIVLVSNSLQNEREFGTFKKSGSKKSFFFFFFARSLGESRQWDHT